jgi:hypothetical protein
MPQRFLCMKSVPNSGYRFYVIGILIQFLSYPADMHIYDTACRGIVVAPEGMK